MRKKKDYISEIIKRGAFVVPPKRLPAVEEIIEPAPTEPISGSVEALAESLDSHFHPNPEPEITESENVSVPDTTDAKDDFVECIVVWLKLDDPLGRPPVGVARPQGAKHGSRDGYGFNFRSIVTEGAETVKVGTRVRGRVVEPEIGQKSRQLVDIEIYKSEED